MMQVRDVLLAIRGVVNKDYKGKIFFVSVLSCLKQVVSTNVHAPVSSNTIHSMAKWLWLTLYKLSAGAVGKHWLQKFFND